MYIYLEQNGEVKVPDSKNQVHSTLLHLWLSIWNTPYIVHILEQLCSPDAMLQATTTCMMSKHHHPSMPKLASICMYYVCIERSLLSVLAHLRPLVLAPRVLQRANQVSSSEEGAIAISVCTYNCYCFCLVQNNTLQFASVTLCYIITVILSASTQYKCRS